METQDTDPNAMTFRTGVIFNAVVMENPARNYYPSMFITPKKSADHKTFHDTPLFSLRPFGGLLGAFLTTQDGGEEEDECFIVDMTLPDLMRPLGQKEDWLETYELVDRIGIMLAASDGYETKRLMRARKTGQAALRPDGLATDTAAGMVKRAINLSCLPWLTDPEQTPVSSVDLLEHIIPGVTDLLGIGYSAKCRRSGDSLELSFPLIHQKQSWVFNWPEQYENPDAAQFCRFMRPGTGQGFISSTPVNLYNELILPLTAEIDRSGFLTAPAREVLERRIEEIRNLARLPVESIIRLYAKEYGAAAPSHKP